MRLYKITNDDPDAKPNYVVTLSDAHNAMKEMPKHLWNSARAELVEVATDQKTIANMLSGWGWEENVLRTWKLTPRGGLTYCENNE